MATRSMTSQGRSLAFLALLQLVGALGLTACAGTLDPRPRPLVRSAFFALSVSDLRRLAQWYRENLGFRMLRQYSTDGIQGAILARQGALLELLQFATARSRQTLGLANDGHDALGIVKLGFEVANLDREFAAVRGRGAVLYFPVVRPPGSDLRTFAILDPDGNIVQFFGT